MRVIDLAQTFFTGFLEQIKDVLTILSISLSHLCCVINLLMGKNVENPDFSSAGASVDLAKKLTLVGGIF